VYSFGRAALLLLVEL